MKVFVKKYGKTSFFDDVRVSRTSYLEFIVAVERLNEVVAKTTLISVGKQLLHLNCCEFKTEWQVKQRLIYF